MCIRDRLSQARARRSTDIEFGDVPVGHITLPMTFTAIGAVSVRGSKDKSWFELSSR